MEKRFAGRIKKRLAVRYSAMGQSHIASTFDISESGLFIMASEVFPVDTEVRVEIDTASERLNLHGVVVWSRKVPKAVIMDLRGGMGIHIDDRDPAYLRLLCDPSLSRSARSGVPFSCAAPGDLFKGNCSLSVQTDKECRIYLNGVPLGTTKNHFLAVNNLIHGEHRLEARTDQEKAETTVALKPDDVRLVELRLQPLPTAGEKAAVTQPASLKALSQIGPYTLTVDGRSYTCPTRIDDIAPGKKTVRIEVDGIEFEESLELSARQTTQYELTMERVAAAFKLNPTLVSRLRPTE